MTREYHERPVCIDLYAGLGGWAEGFLAEGYDVIGYDIEKHEYGEHKYPGTLILKDVLDLTVKEILSHNPRVIVASPPCTEPSYRAMPWSRAKALNSKPPSTFLCLFYACFKLAHDAGTPIIVENVRGAVPWVGPAKWHYGSYYLWGDVPALMPITLRQDYCKCPNESWNPERPSFTTDKSWKNPGFRFDGSGRSFQSESVKTVAHLNQRDGHSHTRHLDGAARHGSKSNARRMASAMIAKIPFPLASHIARTFR